MFVTLYELLWNARRPGPGAGAGAGVGAGVGVTSSKIARHGDAGYDEAI